MPVRKEGQVALVLVVIGLYSLLLFSLAQTIVVLFLYATRSVDATISASLILAFVGSQLSLLFLFIHSMLARSLRLAPRLRLPHMQAFFRTPFNFICRFLPRVLIMFWMVASAAGLIVAARQPRCMSGHAMQNFWKIGLSCQLHRAVVGMAVVAFVSICTVFCCIEVSNRPYDASLLGILESDQEESRSLKPSISGLSWSSTSSSDSLRREKLYQYRPLDLEHMTPDRALWLQRRNSQSSQSAMYPSGSRYSSNGPLSPPGSFHLNGSPLGVPAQLPYILPHRSTSFSSTRTPSPSALGNVYSSLPPTRAASTISSASRSSSSTSARRSPLSTMRRASEPEVPIIPARFLDAEHTSHLQRSPTLPCFWSLSLSHAPLSTDPAIRAFSTETESSPEQSAIGRASTHNPTSDTGMRFVGPSQEMNISSQTSIQPPQLPVRARGHTASPKAEASGLPSLQTPGPAVTYSTRPRISPTPSSSALHIPRARPALTADPNITNTRNSTVKRPQLIHNYSSSHSNRTISSALSTDFTTHSIMEAQRVKIKKRWERARGREADAYGMGGWGGVTNDNKETVKMSLRKASEGRIKKKRAFMG